MICDICNNLLNIPIALNCNHFLCLLCFINNSMTCTQCDNTNIIPHNYTPFDYTNYLWLYSSNYNGLWWCYDSDSNSKIEALYKDYLLRHNSNESESSESNEISIVINKSPKKKNKGRAGKTERK